MRHRSIFVIALIGLSLLAATPATAATRTWTGTGTNWNTATNWSGAAIPTNGDAVVIPSSITVKPSMPPGTYPTDGGSFLSFELQAGVTNYCLGDTNAINGPSGGIEALKHGTGVAINCQNATIAGTLSADRMGFGARLNRSWITQYGGPGFGKDNAAGGSYGGMEMLYANPLKRYGSLTQPTALGSGAGLFGEGGGAIKIAVTNILTVNGSVTANAGDSEYSGGAGGSIWLVCDRIAGTGTISAYGANGDAYAGGGGGRISIECQSNAFQGAIKIGCGYGALGGKAQAGALWFPKWFAGREGTRGNPTDLWLPGPKFGVRYWFADSTVTQYWNVYMTNSWLEFYAGSAAISNLAATNSCFWIYENGIVLASSSAMSNLAVYGSMYLTNSTLMYLPPYGVYDMSGDFTIADANSVVYALTDTNAVNADSGGTGSIKHGIGLSISCRHAVVAGKIDGIGKGFSRPDGGPSFGSYLTGGAYGGWGDGGDGTKIHGACYGSLTRPTALGSKSYDVSSSQGGGAVRLKATGTLTLNGSINVNGIAGWGGGSGGSVWLQAGTLSGSGAVLANGATRIELPYGGGGGGRIAIEYGTWNYSGAYTVNCEAHAKMVSAKTGTIFLCQSPWLGTATTNGVNGKRLDTQFSVSSNNVQITRSITRFDTSLKWSDTSTTVSNNIVITNTSIYTISGLRPSRGYSVYWDGTNQFGGQIFTSTNGMLTFTNTLNMLRNFLVTPAERGTIMTVY